MCEQVIKATSVWKLMSSFCDANYLLSCHGTIHMQLKFNANILYNKRHKLFPCVQYVHMDKNIVTTKISQGEIAEVGPP